MEDTFILQQSVFQMLAAAAEIKSLYGIRPPKTLCEAGQHECLYMIHEMVEQGILIKSPDGFLVQEPYKEAMMAIKSAEIILAVEDRQGKASVFYCGKSMICLEESVCDVDSVRISRHALEELKGLLADKGYMPKPRMAADLAYIQTEQDFRNWLGDKRSEEELPYLFRYRIFDNEKKLLSTILLLDNPCDYWITQRDDAKWSYSHYDPKGLFDRIEAYMKGGPS